MPVSAAEIHVMSGGAPKEVFTLLAPRFEEQTDNKVEFTYAVITELREKLSAGATADVSTIDKTRTHAPSYAAEFLPRRSLLSLGLLRGIKKS
jgi:ABC-type molybdate transport system substrate-binding protein